MTIVLYLLTAYLTGSIMFAYIIGRFAKKVDIRTAGSGNVGARNIGRVLGKKAFIATFIGDATKASLIILLGKMLSLPLTILLLAFLAVIIGHIWPITLKFQGGKGVASYLGGILTLEPTIIVPLVATFLFSMLILRNFTKAGLLSLAITPFTLLFYQYSILQTSIIILTTLLIIHMHRFSRIKE